ncbi:hypothetical protein CMV_007118 [Castanea mollissima]|uniref:Uncharacterized protein n=1 Tax=Castanea mollissima TaxID=60419 RepID=A0A8J4VQJ0_9ROSI|nr:hypothetical protein CMV_007118 [Castanea mollissima]
MSRRQHQDQQSKVFHELSALVLNILRSPPAPIPFSDDSTAPMTTTRLAEASASRRSSTEAAVAQITPAGFASLMLGISLALMLCGSLGSSPRFPCWVALFFVTPRHHPRRERTFLHGNFCEERGWFTWRDREKELDYTGEDLSNADVPALGWLEGVDRNTKYFHGKAT